MKITKPFYLGMYQVTQAEYEKVMGVNPSACTASQMDASALAPPPLTTGQGRRQSEVLKNGRYAKMLAGSDTSRHPVETVVMGRRVEFCRAVGAACRGRGGTRLSFADRGRVGVRLSSGDDDPLVLRRRPGGIVCVRLVF